MHATPQIADHLPVRLYPIARGAAAIDAILRGVSISGRVEIGGDIQDRFADLPGLGGSMIETVALSRTSYSALKNRWMRRRIDVAKA